jgi:hypothetical protein
LRLGQVAAGKWSLEALSQRQKAVEEAVDPPRFAAVSFRQILWQTQRQKGSYRTRTHGSKVAQSASQRPVPDRLGRVPIEPKVSPCD